MSAEYARRRELVDLIRSILADNPDLTFPPLLMKSLNTIQFIQVALVLDRPDWIKGIGKTVLQAVNTVVDKFMSDAQSVQQSFGKNREGYL